MFRIDRTRVNLASSQNIQNIPTQKAEQVPSPSVPDAPAEEAVPARREEISEQDRALAEKLIADASREAEEMARQAAETLEKAGRDAELIRAEAKAQGYEEGKSRAETDYVAFIKENDAALNRVIAEIARGREEMFANMEGELIDLCFAIIRKIATMDRARDGELFRSIIKKTLSQMELSEKFMIRLSTEDFERFFPSGEASFTVGDSQITASVVDDQELRGGDIVVESDNETVTAGVETQIKCIELAFRRMLGKSDE